MDVADSFPESRNRYKKSSHRPEQIGMNPQFTANRKPRPNSPELRGPLRAYRILFWLLACALPDLAYSLEFPAIEKAYQDGELGEVKADLEGFLKEQGEGATREELIFSYKYLGVVYAADSSQQAKAESYFHRLLTLSPQIQILDLYPSPRIQEIFQRIQTEFRARTEYTHQYDSFGNPVNLRSKNEASTSPSGKPIGAESNKRSAEPIQTHKIGSSKPRLWMWIGGIAVVGGGIAAYWWFQREPEDKNQQL